MAKMKNKVRSFSEKSSASHTKKKSEQVFMKVTELLKK